MVQPNDETCSIRHCLAGLCLAASQESRGRGIAQALVPQLRRSRPAVADNFRTSNCLCRGPFVWVLLWAGFTAMQVLAQPNDLSLARSFPPDRLRSILVPRDQWRPFPPISDRKAWQALPAEAERIFKQQGEAALTEPVPALPATLYLEFARDGNRSRFEAQNKARRQRLSQLVVAECLEAQGRFLDAIANLAWAICEESSWCYPAHISVQKAGRGLPDVSEPIVDLFSAETAVSLAWTLHLLGDRLDQVSPLIRPRIVREIDGRILTPFLERDDFGWMAFHEITRANRPNNWNPWINASVLTAALLVEPDAERRVELVHKVLRSVDRFLVWHPADGSCDEGPGYWGHAGGSLFDTLELLQSATAGQLDLFDKPLIREIGRFIYRAHIAGDWYVPVGDCSARMTIYRERVFRYGQRIGDPHLQALGASAATAESVLASAGDRYFGRLLPALFHLSDILAFQPARPPFLRDVWLSSDDMELMAARDREGSGEGLYVAAWGGHNDQSHNHNDVGNFIVFAEGQPVLVDVGVSTYTAKTFSNQRYDIWVMQSAYHNLPTINGVMQRSGGRAAARSVHYETGNDFAQLRMELGAAYPAEAKVQSWIRTVRLNRGRDITIADDFQLKEASGPTTQNLMTPLEVIVVGPGRLLFTLPSAGGQAGRQVVLEYDAAKLTPQVERVEIEDERLGPVWGDHVSRVVLNSIGKPLQDQWRMRVALVP